MESTPTSTITDNFNPFDPQSATYLLGATSLIYETLLQFDVANPSKAYDFLATGYKWGAGGKSITFTIRQRRQMVGRSGVLAGRRRVHLQPAEGQRGSEHQRHPDHEGDHVGE